MLQQQRQLQAMVYASLANTSSSAPQNGWQASLSVQERLGKTLSLISNTILALPSADWQKAASFGMDVEKRNFLQSADRQAYEREMTAKIHEMVKRREANAPGLQNQLNADAARQAQLQAQQQQQQQQQQMMMNQMVAARGLGQQGQHGFQHLQHPMQVSQIPQQQQQQQQQSQQPMSMGMGMGMGMGNPGMLQNRPEQRQFQPPNMAQQRPQGFPADISQLSPQDKARVMDAAGKLYQQTPDNQKLQIRNMVQSKMTPVQLGEFQTAGRDPAMLYFQNQAFFTLQRNMQTRMMQARQQGLQTNALQQAQHQGQMNQALINSLGPQQGVADAQLFPPTMETIRNEQQMGLMAQQAGQMVVPANSAPGRNATPGPMNGLSVQAPPNNQQGSGQGARPPQMQQQFMQPAKMDQMAAQMQAQAQAQAARATHAARSMQGQPGGLAGPPPNSQSPAMNTLTAPMRQPPVPMSQPGGQPGAHNPQQLGVNLNPQFSHQANARPTSMQGGMNMNNPIVTQMLAGMDAEARANLTSLPEAKMQELMARWQQQAARSNPMNRGLQGVPKQAQMPGVIGMPGQNQPGPMNNASQFTMGGNPQQPGGAIPPSNQPGSMQQQQQQTRMQNLLQQPQTRAMMDSMDVPQSVLNQLRGNIPPDTRKWGQLKHFMVNNSLPATMQAQLLGYQAAQFKQLYEKNAKNQAAALQAQQAQQRPMTGGPPTNIPGAQQQKAQPLPPGVSFPSHLNNVLPHELESFRKNPRFSNVTDEYLVNIIISLKKNQFTQKYWQDPQNQNQQPQGNIPADHKPQVHVPTVPTPQPVAAPPAASVQPNARHAAPLKTEPDAPAPASATLKNARVPQPNRIAPPNPSPATAQKNLKRPNSDDVADVPAQAANTVQRPLSQPDGRRQLLQPNQEQIAKLTPDQKKQYETMLRNRQNPRPTTQILQATPEELGWLQKLGQEESQFAHQQHWETIAMSQEDMDITRQKLKNIVPGVKNMTTHLAKWYHIAKDDAKARQFLRTRFRVFGQFVDREACTVLRDTLTITKDEVDQLSMMIQGFMRDMQNAVTSANARQPAPAPGTESASQSAAQQPAPATQANVATLEKQTQALKQAQNRPGGRAGQAPAAPTTSQPPFPFGAQKSPTGEPTYFSKPTVTQQTLNPPPARKKVKTGQPQTSSPSLPQVGASPQTKVPSPELKRQSAPEPVKPQPKMFMCPEPNCDAHTAGFPTEEARDAHNLEEHIKPNEDPMRFVHENLAIALGLDSDGNSKATAKVGGQEAGNPSAPAMGSSLSKQGQTPMTKAESAATPMSRDASMRRQGSTTGGKSENTATPGRNIKSENTPRLGDSKLPVAKPEFETPQQMGMLEDPWANTIDPQSLFAGFAPLDSAPVNMLTDFNAYRSSTPNDTPESSKDSGASEPNSDISEGMLLDIDLSWQNMDTDVLLDMNNISVDGFESMESEFMGAESMPFGSLDDMSNDFSKPFHFDSSLYSMDTI
ncbi:hypothetical protein B0T25DRAFT_451806 [Lasiosphaeria hispida]|uniref:Mediator complex subunit 15 KIX domain-containing protein n=1 Tax=Lasiosphaeria hispida TaxID=260671 RepID=A0AAJ0MFZ8_9PEZI|nr:hypothetical protein B0T25DRAFT_451806 [Lasiosphaeria hispida]